MRNTLLAPFADLVRSVLGRVARRIVADRFDILAAAAFASPFSLMVLIVALHTGAPPLGMPAWLFAVYLLPLAVTASTLLFVVVGAVWVVFQHLVARARRTTIG